MASKSGFRAIGLFACAALLGAHATPSRAAEPDRGPCTEDAMLVFDASGSMAGNEQLGIATQDVARIDKVRAALAKVLPSVTRLRRVGLITYGPGPYAQCNVHLSFAPKPDAASLIMSDVRRLVPAGKTPLSSAVEQAAEVLDYTKKPGVIVLLTDGEETCGGTPCDLGKFLHANAVQLTVLVIGYRVKDFSWTGEQSILDVKCLAEQNGGIYVAAENEAELEQALEKTLGCPMLSQILR
jgi:Ca-activated chloride channel family protein